MTDNVIEKLIEQWKGAASQMRPEQGHPVVSCAQTLHERTRPEQFMPSLSQWPEWANWCAMAPNGRPVAFDAEPEQKDLYWDPLISHGHYQLIVHDWPAPPLGIDWRLLKVSRQQMEAWEAER